MLLAEPRSFGQRLNRKVTSRPLHTGNGMLESVEWMTRHEQSGWEKDGTELRIFKEEKGGGVVE